MFFKKKEKAIVTHPVVRMDPKWIPIGEKLPDESGKYLVTSDGEVKIAVFYKTGKWNTKDITAWRELPEPYDILK